MLEPLGQLPSCHCIEEDGVVGVDDVMSKTDDYLVVLRNNTRMKYMHTVDIIESIQNVVS